MTTRPQRPAPMAGGVLIAIGAIVGAFVGATQGQPSFGFLLGLAAGIALATAVWLRDRAR
ncbi:MULTISPECIES: hypothetical protein [Sphingomonas]|uniref:hypothetical protein n=1 Tax=Sphingomonas TaxID=13687 RepID=UPI0008356D61|nr:hypothetical protein [Sphingomonas sp. CCH10-B3]MBA3879005.1 hypothetical protein [Sphingobium sp.]